MKQPEATEKNITGKDSGFLEVWTLSADSVGFLDGAKTISEGSKNLEKWHQ